MGSLVSSGDLDQRVTLLQKTVARGNLGGLSETWAQFRKVWARVDDMTGREIFAAKGYGSASSMMVTTRYIEGITDAMNVQFSDGTIARIEWMRVVNRKQRMELYCLLLDDGTTAPTSQ